MTLFKKEWKLVMMPVPLLFLLLSGLVLIPNYPYYVTFFYTTLGIFLMMHSARENRDLYYMALLPITKTPSASRRTSRFLVFLSCCLGYLTASFSRCTTKTPTIWESRSSSRAPRSRLA